jgi:hypothetical protein
MKTRFLYHAEAVGVTGSITLPFQETLEIQGSLALPINGGHATARVKDFHHRHYLSAGEIQSNVVGSYSAHDKAYGTLAMSVVEKLNILDVVTCDRIVARLTSKHDENGGEPSYILLGTRFENLRIAGHPIDLTMATDLFSDCSTWSKLKHAHANDKNARAELRKLSMQETHGEELDAPHGIYGSSIVRLPDQLPAGLSRRGLGIYVPHFGTVYLGEFYVSAHSRRLLMLHVDLGCSIEGCYGSGSVGGNGSIYP